MRDIVYLSERKLRLFLPDATPWWHRLKNIKVKITAPPYGGFEVDITPDYHQELSDTLKKVVKHIETKAKLHTDDSVEIGDWVVFSVPLNYFLIDTKPESPVVFIDQPTAQTAGTEPTPPRLLLHGAARHVEERLFQTLPGKGRHFYNPGYGSDLDDFYEYFGGWTPAEALSGEVRRRSHTRTELSEIIYELDQHALRYKDSYEGMAGYARVTAVRTGKHYQKGLRMIAATPLFIERAVTAKTTQFSSCFPSAQ